MRQLVSMIVVAIASIANFSIAASSSYGSLEPDSNAPACYTVGNVSASADNGTVTLINYNKYIVTVTWAVYGHMANGSRHEIGRGTEVINAYIDNYNYNMDKCTIIRKYTTSEQYQSYSVVISVQKCD